MRKWEIPRLEKLDIKETEHVIYTYECNNCNYRWEVFSANMVIDRLLSCPKCNHQGCDVVEERFPHS